MGVTNITNQSSIYAPEFKAHKFEEFTKKYPEFASTKILDALRKTEYRRLDDQNQIYLDYTGGGLYAESQLKSHFELMQKNVFGNPHSINPTSMAMTDLVEDARDYVMEYFNASPEDYVLIFTPNASGALKLIGESYPFEADSHYALAFDNHNSVNGIREFAKSKGARVTYIPLTTPTLRMDLEKLDETLEDPGEGNNLFAFPAQSNFSGVQHPLSLIKSAHEKGWDVLLDAAAFVPTNRLDLKQVQPDFVAVSFYKMFGYPTGLGALFMHRRVYEKMRRPWFAGGTVRYASVVSNGHYLSEDEAAFEDGTINYLSIPAIKTGLQHLERIEIKTISERVHCLTGWLIDELLSLKHSNGKPMVRIYGPVNLEARGGTVTLNFYDDGDHMLDYRRIEELANERGISLRTGCFCNPGAGEIAENLTNEEIQTGMELGDELDLNRMLQLMQDLSNKSVGAIRISVGLASNFSDVYTFMGFAAGFRDIDHLRLGKVTFDISGCRVVRDGA